MTKTLTHFGLAIAGILVILIFVSVKTISQLAIAAILYSTLIFLAFMIFPRKGARPPKITAQEPAKANLARVKRPEPKTESAPVADIDRRTFLKLIGATGISFFLISIFGRRFESLFFGRTGQSGTNPAGNDNLLGLTGAAPTEGYKISEVDEGPVTYYGFTNQVGGWLIMREETDGGSFRYAKGDSDFPGSWKSRANLKYDYFYNLF